MGFDPYIACGVLGAGCFVATYFGTLQGWLDVGSWRFPAINLLGAALVLVVAALAVRTWLGSVRSVDGDRLRIAAVTRGTLVRDAAVSGRVVAAVSPNW